MNHTIIVCSPFSVRPYKYLFFLWQKPLGLQSLLDEESTFPNGTDLSFANKLKQHLNSNPCFRGGREKAFTVCHYAGEVFNVITVSCTD